MLFLYTVLNILLTLQVLRKCQRHYTTAFGQLDHWPLLAGCFPMTLGRPGNRCPCSGVKVNLKKKTEFDRLVGQIEGLDPRRNKVLVVLIGETDRDLLGRLEAKYATQIRGDIDVDKSLALVQVSVSES